jgi:hypothetical protein
MVDDLYAGHILVNVPRVPHLKSAHGIQVGEPAASGDSAPVIHCHVGSFECEHGSSGVK